MTQPASPVLVTGATGNTGRPVAEALARRGEAAAVSPAVAEITGRPAIGIRQFARDYAGAFAR